MALEAQALANSIWGHGGHGLTQAKKIEGNKKHLLPFCRYLQGKHEISQEHDLQTIPCWFYQHQGHTVRDSGNGSAPRRDTPIHS